MYLKRQKAPKNWPITRKGTAYIVLPRSDITKGLPLLIILRNMLKLAQDRREVKKALVRKDILLNNKVIKDEKRGVLLFDIIKIVPAKKYYRLTLSENGKFELEEIKENESKHKVAKIINKKMLKGNKMQINLNDGRNILSENKFKVNDSVLVNLESNKIEKTLPLQERAKVMVIGGKHSGKRGEVVKIDSEKGMSEIKTEKENVNVLIKQLMILN